MTEQELLTRFWNKVEFTTDCWNWTANKDRDGYGQLKLNRTSARAHRISYELYYGKIPNGLVIDHLCKNTSCVNPHHMEVVTIKENTMRGVSKSSLNAKKTHCIRGHELKGDNLYKYKNSRSCKICRLRLKREWRNRNER